MVCGSSGWIQLGLIKLSFLTPHLFRNIFPSNQINRPTCVGEDCLHCLSWGLNFHLAAEGEKIDELVLNLKAHWSIVFIWRAQKVKRKSESGSFWDKMRNCRICPYLVTTFANAMTSAGSTKLKSCTYKLAFTLENIKQAFNLAHDGLEAKCAVKAHQSFSLDFTQACFCFSLLLCVLLSKIVNEIVP